MVFRHLKGLKRWFASASAALVLATGPGALPQACAQENDDIKELRQRLDALEKQNKELIKKLDEPQPAILQDRAGAVAPAAAVPAEDLKKAVEGYLAEHGAKAADAVTKAECDGGGFAVGSDLKLNARWNSTPGQGLMFETPNKDYRIHLGGRIMYDTVFWTQDSFLQPSTQVGALSDGMFFRRMRLNADGTVHEVFEFAIENDLEEVSQGVVRFDEAWVGIKDVPLLGSIRIGHIKVPQGLESISSSRVLTFMERSSMFDAFESEFAPGIWITNSVADQHATWALAGYRFEQRGTNIGEDFGDGEYAATGRATFLPIYENEGRCLLHVGGSATWRRAERPDPSTGGVESVRFRSRPAMRDSSGDFGNTVFATPAINILPGNINRWVDTGNIACEEALVYGAELLGIWGPFSIMAEGTWATAHNPTKGDDVTVGGYYVTASYFLTGENRGYDRRLGRLSSNYVPRINTPFWFVRDEDGKLNIGRGAWEIAARYNFLNLNDSFIKGGKLSEFTAGLNWYLCPNAKIQFQYLNTHRWDVGDATNSGFKEQQLSGDAQGFGIRTVFEF